MTRRSDGTFFLARESLCQLAEVERAKHRRWLDKGLLRSRTRYGENDVIQAAALAELTLRLKPSLAQAVWNQISESIGVPDETLEVVVALGTREAFLHRAADAAFTELPRNQPMVIVPLGGRIERARERVRTFRGTAPPALVPASRSRNRRGGTVATLHKGQE